MLKWATEVNAEMDKLKRLYNKKKYEEFVNQIENSKYKKVFDVKLKDSIKKARLVLAKEDIEKVIEICLELYKDEEYKKFIIAVDDSKYSKIIKEKLAKEIDVAVDEILFEAGIKSTPYDEYEKALDIAKYGSIQPLEFDE